MILICTEKKVWKSIPKYNPQGKSYKKVWDPAQIYKKILQICHQFIKLQNSYEFPWEYVESKHIFVRFTQSGDSSNIC